MGLFGISVNDIRKWEKKREVDKIVPALSGKKKEVRLAAITAFGNLRVSNGAPYLISGLNDTDGDIRRTTRLALLRIGSNALADLKKANDQINTAGSEAILQNVSKQVFQATDFDIEYRRQDYMLKIYEAALMGKGKNEYGSKYNEIMAIYNYITDQVSKLTDPVTLVMDGIGILEKNEKVKSVDYRLVDDVVASDDYYLLAGLFAKTEDQSQRRLLFKTICNMDAQPAREAIAKGTTDPDPVIRTTALQNLHKTGRSDQQEILMYLLSDSSDQVVTEAATLLGKTRYSQAIPTLLAALKRHTNWYSEAAQAILQSLVLLGQKPDISGFIKDLDSPDVYRRQSAASVLISVAKIDFSLVRGQWNEMAAKIQKPHVNHNDGSSIHFSDCGNHEDHRRHTDSPGIGITIPRELWAKS